MGRNINEIKKLLNKQVGSDSSSSSSNSENIEQIKSETIEIKNDIKEIKNNIENITNSINTLISLYEDVKQNQIGGDDYIGTTLTDKETVGKYFLKVKKTSAFAQHILNTFAIVTGSDDQTVYSGAECETLYKNKPVYVYNMSAGKYDIYHINIIEFQKNFITIRPFEPSDKEYEVSTPILIKKWQV